MFKAVCKIKMTLFAYPVMYTIKFIFFLIPQNITVSYVNVNVRVNTIL